MWIGCLLSFSFTIDRLTSSKMDYIDYIEFMFYDPQEEIVKISTKTSNSLSPKWSELPHAVYTANLIHQDTVHSSEIINSTVREEEYDPFASKKHVQNN